MNVVCAIVTIPVSAVCLWKYHHDYKRHGRQTILGLLAMCLGIFMSHLVMGLSHPRVCAPETPQQYVGMALMVIGIILTLVSMLSFRSGKKVIGMDTSKLTTSGMYSFSRNPQYLFYSLFPLGYSMTGHAWMAYVGFGLYILIGHLMVLIEEAHLEKVYGEAYRQYKQKTPRYLFM